MYIDSLQLRSGSVLKNRKEKHFHSSFVAVGQRENGHIVEAVTIRFYETDSRTYCCVWLKDNNGNTGFGGGYAGGSGYHKASAAAETALDDAGVTFLEHIDGIGNTAIEDAVKELTGLLGFKHLYTVHAHA